MASDPVGSEVLKNLGRAKQELDLGMSSTNTNEQVAAQVAFDKLLRKISGTLGGPALMEQKLGLAGRTAITPAANSSPSAGKVL